MSTDTPRCDAAMFIEVDVYGVKRPMEPRGVPIDFARQLERGLAAAGAEIDCYGSALLAIRVACGLHGIQSGDSHHDIVRVIERMKAETERLRSELAAARVALDLCVEWFESEENQSIQQMLETESRWQSRGQQGWNGQFIKMIRALHAARAKP